jgi:hypothetical protein
MIRIMRIHVLPVLAGIGLCVATVAAQKSVLPESVDRLTLLDVKAEPVTYRGRQAVRVVEREANRGGGVAIIPGVEFRDGTIDVQLAGQPIAGAAEGSRGFVGIAFRVQRDPVLTNASTCGRPTAGRTTSCAATIRLNTCRTPTFRGRSSARKRRACTNRTSTSSLARGRRSESWWRA